MPGAPIPWEAPRLPHATSMRPHPWPSPPTPPVSLTDCTETSDDARGKHEHRRTMMPPWRPCRRWREDSSTRLQLLPCPGAIEDHVGTHGVLPCHPHNPGPTHARHPRRADAGTTAPSRPPPGREQSHLFCLRPWYWSDACGTDCRSRHCPSLVPQLTRARPTQGRLTGRFVRNGRKKVHHPPRMQRWYWRWQRRRRFHREPYPTQHHSSMPCHGKLAASTLFWPARRPPEYHPSGGCVRNDDGTSRSDMVSY